MTKAVVVYESMYGNTHLISDAIATGLRGDGSSGTDVVVVPVHEADTAALADADLVVVGGPTHAHGVSRENTRRAAIDAAHEPGRDLVVDADAEGPGLRDWFDTKVVFPAKAAAFDTRVKAPIPLTGRASKGIAKRLRAHGCALIAEPESFFVSKENQLLDDEVAHAHAWGTRLAAALRDTASTATR